MCFESFQRLLSSFITVDWDEVSENLNFTELPKIVCGFTSRDLKSEIHISKQGINRSDIFGFTPLSYACSLGRVDHAQTLLSDDADPNLFWGPLPLEVATKAESLPIVELLLKHGAEVPVRTTYLGQTGYVDGRYFEGLAEFAEKNQIFATNKLKLEHGFDFNLPGAVGIPP